MLGAHNWVGVWFREGGRLSGAEVADVMVDTWLAALRVWEYRGIQRMERRQL